MVASLCTGTRLTAGYRYTTLADATLKTIRSPVRSYDGHATRTGWNQIYRADFHTKLLTVDIATPSM